MDVFHSVLINTHNVNLMFRLVDDTNIITKDRSVGSPIYKCMHAFLFVIGDIIRNLVDFTNPLDVVVGDGHLL